MTIIKRKFINPCRITDLNYDHLYLVEKIKAYPHLVNHVIKKYELNVFTMTVTEELTIEDDITPLVACLDKYKVDWRIKPNEEINGIVYFVIVRKPIPLKE